jgi:hypothetical protein
VLEGQIQELAGRTPEKQSQERIGAHLRQRYRGGPAERMVDWTDDHFLAVKECFRHHLAMRYGKGGHPKVDLVVQNQCLRWRAKSASPSSDSKALIWMLSAG